MYAENKPARFTIVDNNTDQRHVELERSADESIVQLLLADHEKESLTVSTDDLRAPLEDDEDYQRSGVIHGMEEYVDGKHI